MSHELREFTEKVVNLLPYKVRPRYCRLIREINHGTLDGGRGKRLSYQVAELARKVNRHITVYLRIMYRYRLAGWTHDNEVYYEIAYHDRALKYKTRTFASWKFTDAGVGYAFNRWDMEAPGEGAELFRKIVENPLIAVVSLKQRFARDRQREQDYIIKYLGRTRTRKQYFIALDQWIKSEIELRGPSFSKSILDAAGALDMPVEELTRRCSEVAKLLEAGRRLAE